MQLKVTYEAHGPLFDREVREEIIHRYCERVENVVGEEGVTLIQVYLEAKYKRNRPDLHPGLYQSGIHTERAVTDHLFIYDTPVVYGPWLEGIGSRNFPVTRFRGYHTFRRVAQKLRRTSGDTAESLLPPYLEELNG